MEIIFYFSSWHLLSKDQYFRKPDGLNGNGLVQR